MPIARLLVAVPAGVGIALLVLSLAAFSETVSIRLEGGAFKVVGWSAPATEPAGGWSSIFAVFASTQAGYDVPPVMGSYGVENGRLVFRPRFPLAPQVGYRAIFRPPGLPAVESVFQAPKPGVAASTRVEHVYPSANLLPANQLKLYLHFSAPMRRGDAWRHTHLLDQTGSPVDLPFLEVDQELWDRDYRRLTVLFDPGRIKRGLTPREQAGPPIEEGNRYTLVIDRDWLDAGGMPLAEAFRKTFRVGPANRTPPDPKQWRLSAPNAGASGALVVDFPEPMDHALLLRLLQVTGPDRDAVVGAVETDRDETQWRFTPVQPWRSGEHHLVVDTALEDLAGNRIGRLFDVDWFDRVSKRTARKTIELPFRIR